jgi:hypothetical protein
VNTSFAKHFGLKVLLVIYALIAAMPRSAPVPDHIASQVYSADTNQGVTQDHRCHFLFPFIQFVFHQFVAKRFVPALLVSANTSWRSAFQLFLCSRSAARQPAHGGASSFQTKFAIHQKLLGVN